MQALNFLFWNINRKPLVKEIANIAKLYNIDVILLAECKELKPVELLLALNAESVDYQLPNPIFQNDRIKVFTKFSSNFIVPVADESEKRVTCFKIKFPIIEKLLVFGVHLPDNRNNQPDSVKSYAGRVARRVKEIEKEQNLKNTIIVGDFNMNPSDAGMVDAESFHAIMDSEIAKKETRIVSQKEYDYFYNPMWSLQGDVGNNVSGSYFYKNAELVNYHWNVFDQVLIRPSLVDNFVKDSLKFIDNDGEKSLLKSNGTPNENKYSDHLPLMFTLNLDLK